MHGTWNVTKKCAPPGFLSRSTFHVPPSFLFLNPLAPIHVLAQRLGDAHAAVGVLVILQDRDQNPRAGDNRVVERVAEADFAVFAAVAQIESSRLEIVEAAGGVRFAVAAVGVFA